jgi:hypothetical protein
MGASFSQDAVDPIIRLGSGAQPCYCLLAVLQLELPVAGTTGMDELFALEHKKDQLADDSTTEVSARSSPAG